MKTIRGVKVGPWGSLTGQEQVKVRKLVIEMQEEQKAAVELARVLSDRAILEAYWASK